MAKYLLFRLLDAVPTVFLVLTLVFITMRLLPGDPAIAVLGENATYQELQLFRHKVGLDLPLWLQYLDFLRDSLTFSFGNSFTSNFPVSQLIALNLPYTIELTIAATIIGTALAIPVGVAAAVRHGEAMLFRAQFPVLLEGVLRRHHQPDLVQAATFEHVLRQCHMAPMRRVEGSEQAADLHFSRNPRTAE